MSSDLAIEHWYFLGCEADNRLFQWTSRDWRYYAEENACSYEAGEMGAEAFWYFFAVNAGPTVDKVDFGKRKEYLGEYLASFYNLEVAQSKCFVEA